jgi:hypothetical protein
MRIEANTDCREGIMGNCRGMSFTISYNDSTVFENNCSN